MSGHDIKPQHTPGPWAFEKLTKWPFGVMVTAANGLVVLEQSAGCYSTDQKSREDNERGVGFKPGGGEFGREAAAAYIATQDANARLIAAAPELLAALQECADYIDMIPESAAGGDDDAIRLARLARAAIKKATEA